MHTTGHFYAKNGYKLFEQAWQIDEPRGAVIIVPGYSEHSGRYAHVAAGLNAAGYDAFGIDHHGFGQSEGKRGFVNALDPLAADLAHFAQRVRQKVDVPLFILAHSMGGVITCRALQTEWVPVDGVVTSGVATRIGIGIPEPVKMILRQVGKVAPTMTLPTSNGGEISRDPSVSEAFANDPHTWKGGVMLGTAVAIGNGGRASERDAERITQPIYFLHGTADNIAHPAGSEYLFENVGSADKMLKFYDGLYHEILNEPEQDEVIADIVAWLDVRVERVNEGKKSHHKSRRSTPEHA